ncbi:RHS repeat-associated core domain-containing protein [Clostridium sp.]|uniref:RHS repeat-associated core domain-containing protein n=1 Tax=Clostridium sp. TaxID=1506 RepID=UPI002FC987B5
MYNQYRYDTENGLYYLQSRYYNPEWGRFINADTIVGEVGEPISHNMFAYCNNDPVNMEDPDGDIAWWVGAAVGGALFDTAVYLFQHRNEGFSWSGLGKAAATGALTGVAFAGAGKFVAKGARALVSARKSKPIYSNYVLKRMADDKFHRFPASFENSILPKKPVVRPNGRKEYLQRGYVNGKEGVYHITLDNGGKVMRHRAFIPKSDWSRYSKRWGLPSLDKVKW